MLIQANLGGCLEKGLHYGNAGAQHLADADLLLFTFDDKKGEPGQADAVIQKSGVFLRQSNLTNRVHR